MARSRYLGRHNLTSLFTEVAEILQQKKVVAHVFIVGGTAMALGYDSERYTVDVDALVLDGHGHLIKAVHEVADRYDLLASWFNEQAVPFVSKVKDPRPLVVFDHPSLRVFAASPEHLLAMKVLASRPADEDDIHKLAGIIGLENVDDMVEIVNYYFPCEDLNQRSLRTIQRIFDSNEP